MFLMTESFETFKNQMKILIIIEYGLYKNASHDRNGRLGSKTTVGFFLQLVVQLRNTEKSIKT